MSPNSPRTEEKISMTRILTNLYLRQHTLPRLLHKIVNIQAWIRSVGQCRTGPVDTDTDSTNEIAHAHEHARPEQRISGVVVAAAVECIAADGGEFGGEDDGHDDAVDGDNFAEDDGDEVFGADSRGFDAAAEDGGAGDEDAPAKFQLP